MEWYEVKKPKSVSVYQRMLNENYYQLVRACNVGLFFLDYRFTIPNYSSRLLLYLMEKKFIIAATDPNCDTGSIAEAKGYGFWCPSNDVKAFTQCINGCFSLIWPLWKRIDISSNMYKYFFKRLFDFCIALVVLLLIGWFLIIITIWLHFANNGAGAFFFQERPGKDAKIFKVIKFKTMTDERDEEGNLLPDAQRLTKVGKFVRSTSIDELPQLINVLKGDMALIGPRPLYVRYLPYYTDEEQRRHEVRPGISGWAQCHGRKSITWTQKMQYDVEYVDKCSFGMDFKIILTTIKQVLAREDVGVATSGTNDFNDYREREWAAQGRQDLIDKAREEVKKLA
jgi:lipopolysaccharide/colanic/teichoic acid biosynthesis glycosyltransferase